MNVGILYFPYVVLQYEKIERSSVVATKNEKFVELAEKRVTRAIKDIRLIGNLSNKNNYSYTEGQVQKILAALEQELRLLRAKFSSKSASKDTIFKL